MVILVADMRLRAKVVPDGGWGWMVVFGVSLVNMGNQSIVSVFGLLYGQEMLQMGYSTVEIALVMNVCSMVTNFSGFITGPVLKKYGARAVAFTGVLLTSCGIIFASFAKDLTQLLISYSLLTGLGLGLIIPSTFVAVNSYFSKRRSSAVGLSMVGTGIGQMLMPQVVRFLLDLYGYAGTSLILGGIALHGLAGCLLCQPVERHMKSPEEEECERQECIGLLSNINNSIQQQQQKTQQTKQTNEEEHENKSEESFLRSVCRRISTTLDLELLKDPIFVHIIIGLSMVYTSSVAFSMLFPFYLISIGLNKEQTALSMSLLSAADIIARLTIPLIAARLQLGNRITFLYGALMLALCRSFLVWQTTLGSVYTASVLCGYVRAATVINQNLTVSEYSDEKKLPTALGLNMVAKGLVVLTLGQFFGWIRDTTNSYTFCIHFQSVFLLLVALSWSSELLIRKCSSKNVEVEQTT